MTFETERRTETRRDVTSGGNVVQQHEEVVQQNYVPPVVNATYGESVVEDEAYGRHSALDTARRVVWFITGAIVVDLAARFLLKLLGANTGNAFVDFVYATTDGLTAPFRGIFGEAASGGSVFEPSTLVAMLVYPLIAWGIVSLLRIALGGPSRGVREYHKDVHSVR